MCSYAKVLTYLFVLMFFSACDSGRDTAIEKDLMDLCLRRAARGGAALKEEANWVRRRVRTSLVRRLYHKPGGEKGVIDDLLKQYNIKQCPALKRWGDLRYMVLSVDRGYGKREINETLRRLNLRLSALEIKPGEMKDGKIYIRYHWKKGPFLRRLIRRGEIRAVFIDDQIHNKTVNPLPDQVKIVDKGWIKYFETDGRKKNLKKMKRALGKGRAGYQLITIDGKQLWRGYLIEENLSRSAGELIQQVSIYQSQHGDYGFQATLTRDGHQFFFQQERLHSQRAVAFLLNNELLLAPVFREGSELHIYSGGRLTREEMVMIGAIFHSGPLAITLKIIDQGYYIPENKQ